MTKRKIDRLGEGFNSAFSRPAASARSSKGAIVRDDGELYERPRPNPFKPDWAEGYDDGLEGRDYSPPLDGRGPENYRDGYHCGTVDREEIERTGSSNA